MEIKKIKLKPGKNVPVSAGHPWIFSGGIVTPSEKIATGEIVDVLSADGIYTGSGSYHAGNSIRTRIFTRDKNEKIDRSFFKNRFRELLEKKKNLLPGNTDGFRLVHGDADSIPGLIVDIYNDTAVIQINTAAVENFRDDIVEELLILLNPAAIIERSDIESRKKDNLRVLNPVYRFGHKTGATVFQENGIKMIADCIGGQKTGFFLDQRDARLYLKTVCSGKKVLDLFCCTGSFSVTAAVSGAVRVTGVDVSEKALHTAEELFKLNSSETGSCSHNFIKADVFEYMFELIGNKNQAGHDIIICDPPAFAKSKNNLEEAVKAYIKLNRLCFEHASSGTIIITGSCSGMIGWDEFNNIIRIAAGKSGKDAVILRSFSQAPDHTRKISFPEGSYLKTLAVQVL